MIKKPKAGVDLEILNRELSSLKQSREKLAYSVTKLDAQLAKERQGLALIDGAIQQTEHLIAVASTPKKPDKEVANG